MQQNHDCSAKNPILPGFYPDPSICRVEDDYYLVTSTFAYFPAVPIFHSKDLVHFEQIGNVLDRKEQVDLTGAKHSGGIFAPTLRYHKGIYYMITTNVSHGGNFIVTATNPSGPWSDPYFLEGADGIDPSLFFDEDDRCYYTGTKSRREGASFYGDNEIYLQELDLEKMCLIGESYPIWHSALRNAVWPEGPHLYKKDGYYYLMISEGGTAHEHAITIARSKDITKPFVGNPSNPIVTHRHLGRNYPIVNVGHGDLVETQKGEWWMVLLASRPYGGYYRNLGRETFLVPVTWEEGWPVVNYGVGLVEETFTLPDLEPSPVHPLPLKDDFDEDTLHPRYLYLRNPNLSSYSLTTRAGFLHMKLMSETIDELSSPSFVAIRQTSKSFVTKTSMQFAAQTANECAGLVILQSNAYYYQLTSTLIDGQNTLHLIKCEDGQKTILASQIYTGNTLYLSLEANLQDLTFAYSTDGVNHHTLMANVDGRILCTDRAGGFVGNCIGLYCSSNGHESTNHADFDWFSYESID